MKFLTRKQGHKEVGTFQFIVLKDNIALEGEGKVDLPAVCVLADDVVAMISAFQVEWAGEYRADRCCEQMIREFRAAQKRSVK